MDTQTVNSGIDVAGANGAPAAISPTKTEFLKPIEEKANGIGTYMGERVRIGSRIVRIEQVPQFSMLPKDIKAKQLRDEVIKKIGSQWKRGTKDVIRGLSHEEELKYLPPILGLKPTHDEWETTTKNFWFNYVIQVQADSPVELETGFKYKNPNSDSLEAEPIDINGYMSYKFAQQNNKVAKEGDDNAFYTFRMIDTAADAVRMEEEFSLKRTVDRLYLKLCNDAEKMESEVKKVDYILELYGGKHGSGMNTMGLTLIQKMMELGKVKDADLERFKKIIEDPQLESRALIKKGIRYSKIDLQGASTYYYQGTLIGRSEREAVAWLNDPNNSHAKVLIMEGIKDATS